MKLFLMLALTLSSTLALAGEKYICRETGADDYNPHKMILTQVGDDSIKEGKFYAFKLEIFKGNSAKAIVSEAVNVRTEDVMFKFTNTAKKISGIIFLDEPDQASVTINKKSMSFDCN